MTHSFLTAVSTENLAYSSGFAACLIEVLSQLDGPANTEIRSNLCNFVADTLEQKLQTQTSNSTLPVSNDSESPVPAENLKYPSPVLPSTPDSSIASAASIPDSTTYNSSNIQESSFQITNNSSILQQDSQIKQNLEKFNPGDYVPIHNNAGQTNEGQNKDIIPELKDEFQFKPTIVHPIPHGKTFAEGSVEPKFQQNHDPIVEPRVLPNSKAAISNPNQNGPCQNHQVTRGYSTQNTTTDVLVKESQTVISAGTDQQGPFPDRQFSNVTNNQHVSVSSHLQQYSYAEGPIQNHTQHIPNSQYCGSMIHPQSTMMELQNCENTSMMSLLMDTNQTLERAFQPSPSPLNSYCPATGQGCELTTYPVKPEPIHPYH